MEVHSSAVAFSEEVSSVPVLTEEDSVVPADAEWAEAPVDAAWEVREDTEVPAADTTEESDARMQIHLNLQTA